MIDKLKDGEHWNYSSSFFYNAKSKSERVDIDFIGFGMTKTKFIDMIMVSNHYENQGRTWIKDRVSKSGNKDDHKLVSKFCGRVIVIVGGYPFKIQRGTILEIVRP